MQDIAIRQSLRIQPSLRSEIAHYKIMISAPSQRIGLLR